MPKTNKLNFFFWFVFSLCLVAFAQPARIGWLGALAAVFGYAIFFYAIPVLLSRVQRFVVGTSWFAVVQLIQLSWMTSIEFQGYYILIVYAALALWLGLQFGLLAMFVPAEGKLPVQQMLFCASLWTLMEWMRLSVFCGFSWNPIGLALTQFILSLQFSSLFGVLGLSFWVMLTNLAALNALRYKSVKQIGWLGVLAISPYFYGCVQLHLFDEQKIQKTVNVALLQTDLLPSEKILLAQHTRDFISPFEQWERVFKSLKESRALKRDLVVLPEAAVAMPSDLCNYPYFAVRSFLSELFGADAEGKMPPLVAPFAEQREFRGQKLWCVSNLFWCQVLANLYDAEVVIGLDHADRIAKKNFNSIFYFRPQNLTAERYDKQILLPLAEYLPWDVLRPLAKSYGIHDFYSHGAEAKVFGVKIPFSPSICYEETFSESMRRGKMGGAELFVNVTNDNYFPNSSLHRQHLFHARIRAVENGIPLIRACNSGITAAIDCFGRVLMTLEGGTHGKCEGSLNFSLSALHFPTLFSFCGEGGVVGLCFIFFSLPVEKAFTEELQVKNFFVNILVLD